MKRTNKPFKGRVFLQNLQKPLAHHATKVCSIKEVCKGVPLPNDRDHFYPGASGCKACTAARTKRKWEEKKAARDII